jgi:hypothetical protein
MQEDCYLTALVFALGEEGCLVRAMLAIAESAAWVLLQRVRFFGLASLWTA